jgi:hypothetical protein
MDTESLTRERAYLLWQQAGCPDGRSEEFWHAAAAGLAGAVAPERSAEPAPPAKQPAPRRRAGGPAGGKSKRMTSINPAPAPAPIMPA